MISLSGRILDNIDHDFIRRRKPDWLRARLPGGPGYERLRAIFDEHRLHTVCESARCPNLGDCWSRGTATIMILGDVCTRSCGFCHITTGRPPVLDADEPTRVGESVALMNLRHIVITSVNRDELSDGGAAIWAETIRRIREHAPRTSVEVLIPDFCGDPEALRLVIEERPDILNHNMETVRRLYPAVRPQARYDRSIELLRRSKEAGLVTKTGIMVGIGETDDEVERLMTDVLEGSRPRKERAARDDEKGRVAQDRGPGVVGPGEGCEILTIGQYLQPTQRHLPIARWVTPAQFAEYKRRGEALGFRHVESGPLVRSSYHAEEQVLQLDR